MAELGCRLRTSLCKMGDYDYDAVYVIYSQGNEKLEQIHGHRRLPRLAAVKKAWDLNVFDYNFTLPLNIIAGPAFRPKYAHLRLPLEVLEAKYTDSKECAILRPPWINIDV